MDPILFEPEPESARVVATGNDDGAGGDSMADELRCLSRIAHCHRLLGHDEDAAKATSEGLDLVILRKTPCGICAKPMGNEKRLLQLNQCSHAYRAFINYRHTVRATHASPHGAQRNAPSRRHSLHARISATP